MKSERIYHSLNFFIVIFVGLTIVDFFYLIPTVISQWQLMEPAENENLVLTWAISRGYASSPNLIAEHGIIPIYPDFYHRISSILPYNSQFSGRLFSVLAYIGITLATFFYAKKRTGSWIVGSLFAILLFGHQTHNLYFLMQRTDAMYIALGFGSLLILWWDLNCDVDLSYRLRTLNPFRCVFAGITLAMSVLTKQTGIVFVLFHFLPFASIWLVERRLIGLRNALLIAGSMSIALIFYILEVNKNIIEDYLFGLRIYGSSSWSVFDALDKQEVSVFITDWYGLYLLGFILAVFMNLTLNRKHFLFVSGAATLAFLVTLKLWTNEAAFSNNFIFISLFGVFLTLYLWPKDRSMSNKCILILPFLIFGISPYINQPKSIIFGESYRYKFANKIISSSTADPILEYIRANPGPYITTRLDNYLLLADRDVEFEASVMGLFTYNGDTIAHYSKDKIKVAAVDSLIKSLHEKISQRYFQGVLLGLSREDFVRTFPELLDNYYPYKTIEINQGDFRFSAVLYVRKKS